MYGSFLNSKTQKLLRASATILCMLLFACVAVYINTQIYFFPRVSKFEGDNWYNPYQNTTGKGGIKANFHAHTRAWAGISNGANSYTDFEKEYRKKNYSVCGISNYFEASQSLTSFPIYEHGININKSHLLAIAPRYIQYFDYPLWQSSSHQQELIYKLRSTKALVVLAHPSFGGGRSLSNMQQLVGYHFVEILSYYSNSLTHWDTALCSGRLAWLLANDDCHNLNTQPIGKHYTVVFGTKNNFVNNMRIGQHYAIKLKNINKGNPLYIKQLQIGQNNQLKYDFGSRATAIDIIADGKLLAKLPGKAGTIQIPNHIAYLRLEVHSLNSSLYTNPILRHKGQAPMLAETLIATNDHNGTFYFRLACAVTLLIILRIIALLRGVNIFNKKIPYPTIN
jgi:hypothetical protein